MSTVRKKKEGVSVSAQWWSGAMARNVPGMYTGVEPCHGAIAGESPAVSMASFSPPPALSPVRPGQDSVLAIPVEPLRLMTMMPPLSLLLTLTWTRLILLSCRGRGCPGIAHSRRQPLLPRVLAMTMPTEFWDG